MEEVGKSDRNFLVINLKRFKEKKKETLQVTFVITNKSGRMLQKYCDEINSGIFFHFDIIEQYLHNPQSPGQQWRSDRCGTDKMLHNISRKKQKKWP